VYKFQKYIQRSNEKLFTKIRLHNANLLFNNINMSRSRHNMPRLNVIFEIYIYIVLTKFNIHMKIRGYTNSISL